MLRLYVDVHVKAAITAGLRRRGLDVVTAQEDGGTRLEDVALLERATALQRVLFSQDDDLLAIARDRQTTGCFSPASSTDINSPPPWASMCWIWK
jgi:predicted nuclease of predicted toxin-antitoxin system